MASRLKLQAFLKTIVKNVYFQPPESLKLEYPCIIYRMSTPDTWHANDNLYFMTKHYQITLINKNPDNTLVDELIKLPLCKMSTSPYCKDNLYHYVFDLYY